MNLMGKLLNPALNVDPCTRQVSGRQVHPAGGASMPLEVLFYLSFTCVYSIPGKVLHMTADTSGLVLNGPGECLRLH